ncbi:MAG: leucyl aminopeptidase family protein [Candidatus Paceibacterota bacterium]
MEIKYNKKEIESAPEHITVLRFKEETGTYLRKTEGGLNELFIEKPKADNLDLQRAIATIRQAVRTAKKLEILNLGISFKSIKKVIDNSEMSEEDGGKLFALNSQMANFSSDKKKSDERSREKSIKTLTVFDDPSNSFKKGVQEGVVIAEEVNKSRDLCNTPGSELRPEELVRKAKEAAKNKNIEVSVLNKKKIEELGMGGILGVASGSDNGPYVIILSYKGASKSKNPIALAGKGITFDTGGLNIKPGNSLAGMHMDMSGAAAVIHTVTTAARLKLKINLVAVVAAVENVIATKSYKPGDIITTMSGKTVEIANTDAEGRLLLADTLTYLEKYKPEKVIDVATLTGASVVALGDKYSALFCQDEKLRKDLLRAGEMTGERLWHMPMGYEYENEMKGVYADLTNANLKVSGGGASTAAAFLGSFVNYTGSWAHIDIAPRMEAGEHDQLAKGSLGSPISTLVEYLKNS